MQDQPHVAISKWTIMQLPDGSRHLVGYIGIEGQGRVSSKIMARDGRVLTTRSGRKYELEGEPGWNPDAAYVWSIWSRVNNIGPDDALNVSDQYVQEPARTPSQSHEPSKT